MNWEKILYIYIISFIYYTINIFLLLILKSTMMKDYGWIL